MSSDTQVYRHYLSATDCWLLAVGVNLLRSQVTKANYVQQMHAVEWATQARWSKTIQQNAICQSLELRTIPTLYHAIHPTFSPYQMHRMLQTMQLARHTTMQQHSRPKSGASLSVYRRTIPPLYPAISPTVVPSEMHRMQQTTQLSRPPALQQRSRPKLGSSSSVLGRTIPPSCLTNGPPPWAQSQMHRMP